jgi:hypothetical protein
MLIFAMERSGIGPPNGTMDLLFKTGVFAFLRCVQNFFSRLKQDFGRTVMEVEKDIGVVEVSQSGATKLFQKSKLNQESKDEEFTFCRAQVNPIIVFLNLDHGSISAKEYTPMASPCSNTRSLLSQHVVTVIKEIEKKKNIIAKEDFAITPYQIVLGDWDDEEEEEEQEREEEKEKVEEEEEEEEKDHKVEKDKEEIMEGGSKKPKGGNEKPLPYKSTLNRDPYNHDYLIGKRAECLTIECLSNLYEVSVFPKHIMKKSGFTAFPLPDDLTCQFALHISWFNTGFGGNYQQRS